MAESENVNPGSCDPTSTMLSSGEIDNEDHFIAVQCGVICTRRAHHAEVELHSSKTAAIKTSRCHGPARGASACQAHIDRDL